VIGWFFFYDVKTLIYLVGRLVLIGGEGWKETTKDSCPGDHSLGQPGGDKPVPTFLSRSGRESQERKEARGPMISCLCCEHFYGAVRDE